MITAIRTLLLVALGLSAMLFADYFGEEATFCAEASGCAAIRASRFSRIFGAPLPLVGIVAFCAQLALSLSTTSRGRKVFVATSVVGGVAALALLGIQTFLIERFCALCVGVDLATIGAAVLAPIHARRAEAGTTQKPLLRGMAILLLGLIAVAAPLGWPEVRPSPPVPEALAALQRPGVVNVVEVADFECPHCRAFHPCLRSAIATFGGEVRLVRIHYPLPGHPHSRVAALAHLCAEEKGKGEAMADFLFTSPDLERATIVAAGEGIGLDPQELDACIDGDGALANLAEHRRLVRALDVRAVPTTFIGSTSMRGTRPEDDVLGLLREAASGEGSRGIPGYLYLGLVAVSIALVIVLARRKPEDP